MAKLGYAKLMLKLNGSIMRPSVSRIVLPDCQISPVGAVQKVCKGRFSDLDMARQHGILHK